MTLRARSGTGSLRRVGVYRTRPQSSFGRGPQPFSIFVLGPISGQPVEASPSMQVALSGVVAQEARVSAAVAMQARP